MHDPVLTVQQQLTTRDLTLLGWLADHGVLTTFQIAKALFPTLDFAQERLKGLYRLGLVDRFRAHKPDGGSYPYHYVLGQLGTEVVAAQRGEELPRRDAARKRREHYTRLANLPHRVGTNQFFIDLAAHARTHPGTALLEWLPESKCRQAATFTLPGDDNFTRAYQPHVRPDGYALWADDDRTLPLFLEFDLGTEPLGVVRDKLSGYEALFNKLRRTWPILFWLHSTVRETHLRQLLKSERIGVLVATGARDHAEQAGLSPAEAVWSTTRGDTDRRDLIDLDHLVTGFHRNEDDDGETEAA